jgi:hypothetical protein
MWAFGKVTGGASPASTFRVKTPQGEVPVLKAAKRAAYGKRGWTAVPNQSQ